MERIAMRIVVLDGHTLNPGDLSWKELESLGECTVYDRTPCEDTISRSEDAEVLLTNKTVLDKEIIEKLPNLKYIGVLATGYNVVDIESAVKHGISVTNVPEYGTQSVAQMVFAHILNLSNRVSDHSTSVSLGKWSESKDFCFWDFPLLELQNKTIGIIGLGKIGSAVAVLAKAFQMNVLAYNTSKPAVLPEGVVMTDLDSLLKESEIVSLHCPLNKQNQGFVNAEFLGKMKSNAFLINTSRGPLIDEIALANALNHEQIAGAGLDVLSEEPPSLDSPLFNARNCYITPHIAWATRDARKRLMSTAIANIKAFFNGQSVNIVNG